MLSCKYQIGYAINSVNPCRESLDLIDLFSFSGNYIELERNTLTSANPIFLHQLNSIRPLKTIHAVQKFLSIGCNLQKPLL